MGFAAGFGAVILADIAGGLWVFRKARASQVAWLTGIVQPVIWVALTASIVSGVVLVDPDKIVLRTKLKFVAIIILLLNGLFLDRLRRHMTEYDIEDFWDFPTRFKLTSAISIGLSQICWWTAILVGFITSSSH